MHPALLRLRAQGWSVIADPALTIPAAILARHGPLPAAWTACFATIALCTDAGEQSWFVTPALMHGVDDSAYAWNEPERQSLKAAEGDPVWTAQITEYWDAHLPLRFSVASGYASWALCLRGPRAGTVVHALAPEFEVDSVVAADLDAYLAQLAG